MGFVLALGALPGFAQEGPRPVRVVPFSLPDLEGRSWTPADIAGKTTLVNVWATWCVPCRAELPFVQRLHDAVAQRRGVAVISISIDEKPADARAFAKKHALTFPVLLGPEFVETHFLASGGLGVPVSWLVDPDGMIRRTPPRFNEKDGEAWLQAMLTLLAESPTPTR